MVPPLALPPELVVVPPELAAPPLVLPPLPCGFGSLDAEHPAKVAIKRSAPARAAEGWREGVGFIQSSAIVNAE